MSWKGFQKGLARTPQNLRQIISKPQHHNDPLFDDLQDRYQSIEVEARKLQTEARRFHQAINGMLEHQIKYSEILEQVYQPISGRVSDPNAVPNEQINTESIEACQQYRQLVIDLCSQITPELEMVNTKIIAPIEEMLTTSSKVKKMFTKREHKQLDLDRHAQTLKKAQDKNDHSVKYEERVYKVENEYEMALQEFEYYNNLLRTELPQMFELQAEFIKPLFQSFYYMQISIFYTLYESLERMKIPHFDMQGDLMATFNQRRGDVLNQTEQLGILNSKQMNLKFKKQQIQRARSDSDSSDPWGSSDDEPVAKSNLKFQALYDFHSDTPGDLNFKEGDFIELLEKTGEGWWKGRIGRNEGLFPVNYVRK